MSIFVAVDTGGTFTDLVSFDADSGEVRCTKSLTTHHDPIEGMLDCVKKTQTNLSAAVIFKHGTTLVINTLLERSGPRIALVTTRGFRDVLDLGRGNRTETFNLFFRRDPPLVPRTLRYEIGERMSADGETLQAPDRDEVETLAAELARQKVEGIAVSFLNAYVDPRHERLVADWLRQHLPHVFITAATELTREWYEYERTSTAAANAYVGPKIGRYVSRLGEKLGAEGFIGQLLLMGSNGGVLSAAHAGRAPVELVESGPVGGCIGAGIYGAALGITNLIAFDMGGTTAKCALVRNGKFDIESTYYAGGYGKGTPIRAPVLDIVEVGAGGGSIAWVDSQNRLGVGPHSAGSKPGPVCYGRGGTETTVTDANLLLGRLNAGRFQGGEMQLDLNTTTQAIERLALRLGYQGEAGLAELAGGILEIATVKMSEAIKRITVQRGQDPRDFALFVYGGGGPLHGAQLARELAIPMVIVPPEPGNFSAIGMLLADIRRDISRTLLRRLDDKAIAAMNQVFDELKSELAISIVADFGEIPIRFEHFADLRFVGQFHTVRLPVADSTSADDLAQAFRSIYRERFGHASTVASAEIVSLHCAICASTAKPEVARLLPVTTTKHEPVTQRMVFHPESGQKTMTKVYQRSSFGPAFRADGPAVIEEYGSTTIIGTRDKFEIGLLGEIRIAVDISEGGNN
ncbi:MAG: hydantoinase/oxoprolinase family protein [Betaproteobacteria bacterium]|nr:hydantoinase/oxoprolinase family protein [Betaproteobacteria bacterium]